MRLGDREHVVDLIDASGHRVLCAAQIRDQRGNLQSVDSLRVGNDFGGVRHLRQQLRRNERADFDFGDARRGFAANPVALGCGRKNSGDTLQSVARADFPDPDLGPMRHMRFLAVSAP